MNYKLIPVSAGKAYAKVSIEDYDLVSQFNWFLTGNGYCFRWFPRNGSKTRKSIMMHRFILEAKKGKEIDHKNGDKLDNRRENIRFVTRELNQQRAPCSNPTGFRGVKKSCNKWIARINLNRKEIHLGTHNTPEAAARAYDKKAYQLYGPLALFNFPSEIIGECQ